MIQSKDHNTLVTLSVSAYRLLLAAYPTEFRREYGPHMLQVFQDYSIRTSSLDGPGGLLRFWAITLLDLAQSAFEEHTQKETKMNRETYIRASGLALAIGLAFFALGFLTTVVDRTGFFWLGIPTSFFRTAVTLGFAVGPILVVPGIFGLRARYGRQLGSVGSGALLVGALGGAVFLASTVLMSLDESRPWWILAWIGWLLVYGGLLVFGVQALRNRSLPRWYGLAAVNGLLFFVYTFVYSADEAIVSGRTYDEAALTICLVVAAIGLVLGFTLLVDAGGSADMSATGEAAAG